MIINLDEQLVDEDGKIEELPDGKPLTALYVARKALALTEPDDRDGDEKADRAELRLRLIPGDIEVSEKERTTIRTRVGKFFPVVTVGQFYKIIGR